MSKDSPEESGDQGPARPAGDARAEYEQRRRERRELAESLARWERRIADTRLAVFAVALVVLAVALRSNRLSWTWSLVPFLAYAVLVVVHDRVRRSLKRVERAVAFYERGLCRLDGLWQGRGVTGERFLAEDHPYAADLDIFGEGSLFERLCTGRTRAGEDTLARWLLGPADAATIRDRHEAIVELRPRLDLREDLELIGAEVREGIDPESLASWGREPRVFTSKATLIEALVLAALAVAAVTLWAATDVGLSPLFFVILLEIAYSFRVRKRVKAILSPIDRRTHDLVLLAELLARLERESFQAPALVRLRDGLATEGEPASVRIARLARLLHLLESKDNQFFAPIAGLLMWTPVLAHAIDSWRVKTGPAIAGWLAAVGEFEALVALAAYAFENPNDPFPEIEEAETCFRGESVGHPLLPEAACVRNDVMLGGEVRVLLVSGSNMSGKSTLLRTVGTNAVLALAGAPVRAARLRVSVLAIGATLRIQDSLQAGRSRFYAEITRVRQLVCLAEGPRPLLFLLDEIFHGTNSHDRVVGAGAVVKGLIDRGAIGLVTTHDLALAQVAESLAPLAANVHFEDQLVDGTMRFDYRMRPGVVQHSNALALMRAVGLDV